MIKVNLLPDEFKKVQKAKKSFEFKMPTLGPRFFKIAVYSISIFIGLHFLLGVSILLKGASLKRLNSKWQSLQPNRLEIEGIKSESVSIEKIVSPINQLSGKRMLWSKELNQLSNLVTPGVWLTKLFIQIQAKDVQKGEVVRVLNLEGCAASLYGDETALIAKFVKALQDDKEFFKYFSEIKLGPMEKAMLDKTPVMNFKIFCSFKKKD